MNEVAEIPVSADEFRRKIEQLEDEMLAAPGAIVDFQTRHYFANGIYAREMLIPAGVMLTGKAHREQHINVVSKGCIRVATALGVKTITAPCTFVSEPGTKRAGFALTETVWTCFHANPTGETDPEKLEELLVEPARPEIAARIATLKENSKWLSHSSVE